MPIMDVHEAELISMLEDMPQWKAWKTVTERMLRNERNEVEIFPKIDLTDARKDVRYRLGTINGLKQAMELPTKAKQFLE